MLKLLKKSKPTVLLLFTLPVVGNLQNLSENFQMKSNEIYAKIWDIFLCTTSQNILWLLMIFLQIDCSKIEKLGWQFTGVIFKQIS